MEAEKDLSVPECPAAAVPPDVIPSGGGLLSTRRRAIAFCAAVPAAAFVLRLLTPYIIWLMARSVPRCLLDRFGLRCPLCGGTHCAAALAGGDIVRAFYYNPYVIAAALYFLVWYVRVLISCFAGDYREVRLCRDPLRFSYVIIAVTLLFWIVRNLPFYRAVLY